MSRLVDLSNALPPGAGILSAIALIGLTVALLCEALARCSTGLDPDHDPDMHEDPFRLDSSGALDATTREGEAA